MRDFFSVLAVLCVTTGLLYALQPVARRIGLVDSPGTRKTHSGSVPMIGGLAVFVGFCIGALMLDTELSALPALLVAGAGLVLIGVIDDLVELSSRARFAAQIIAAGLMIGWGQVVLVDLGALRSDGQLFELGWWAIPFSVFCTVGVINALNMIDGVDGLAGGLALVALCGLAWFAHDAALAAHRDVLIVLAASVLCFVAFNARTPWRSQAAVFMGDAGSMFLGFAITWFFIDLSQGPVRAMSPVTALWLLLVPLFDTVWLLFKRPISGRWPTAASRDHLHHVLQAAGLSSGATTFVLWGMAVLAASVGIIGSMLAFSEAALFYAFLALFALYAVTMAIVSKRLLGSAD